MAPGRFERPDLGRRNGLRPVGQELVDDALAGRFQLGERHDLVHQADAVRLLGVEAFAGQRVAAHLAQADGVVELRDDDGAGDADAHLGDREVGIVGGDHDVAGRR